jgi:hypothetical protein
MSAGKMDVRLKLAPKRPLQHRRQERVQLGGGLSLVALEGVEIELQGIWIGDFTFKDNLLKINWVPLETIQWLKSPVGRRSLSNPISLT